MWGNIMIEMWRLWGNMVYEENMVNRCPQYDIILGTLSPDIRDPHPYINGDPLGIGAPIFHSQLKHYSYN